MDKIVAALGGVYAASVVAFSWGLAFVGSRVLAWSITEDVAAAANYLIFDEVDEVLALTATIAGAITFVMRLAGYKPMGGDVPPVEE